MENLLACITGNSRDSTTSSGYSCFLYPPYPIFCVDLILLEALYMLASDNSTLPFANERLLQFLIVLVNIVDLIHIRQLASHPCHLSLCKVLLGQARPTPWVIPLILGTMSERKVWTPQEIRTLFPKTKILSR